MSESNPTLALLLTVSHGRDRQWRMALLDPVQAAHWQAMNQAPADYESMKREAPAVFRQLVSEEQLHELKATYNHLTVLFLDNNVERSVTAK